MSGGGSNYVFIIVGKRDNPIYEVEFFTSSLKKETAEPRAQFIIHAALDLVDEVVWKNQQMYLKVVDKFNDTYSISAFVTAGHVRFMMLHDTKNEDGIKYFFHEVYELYLKVLLNPFYKANTPITSSTFQKRVKHLGRKYLTT
ncbi:Trafficking protein particle complex subunit 2 [Balamuthia mandrillaris]